ncbi:hypothetical protein LTR08_001426 [Meristemomyces frigidus]|nr:hypothetical protein LTR08_001426 [Meristemomyces frigidus]
MSSGDASQTTDNTSESQHDESSRTSDEAPKRPDEAPRQDSQAAAAANNNDNAASPRPYSPNSSLDDRSNRSSSSPRNRTGGIPTAGGVAVGAPVTEVRERWESELQEVQRTIERVDAAIAANSSNTASGSRATKPKKISLLPEFDKEAHFDLSTRDNTYNNLLKFSSYALLDPSKKALEGPAAIGAVGATAEDVTGAGASPAASAPPADVSSGLPTIDTVLPSSSIGVLPSPGGSLENLSPHTASAETTGEGSSRWKGKGISFSQEAHGRRPEVRSAYSRPAGVVPGARPLRPASPPPKAADQTTPSPSSAAPEPAAGRSRPKIPAPTEKWSTIAAGGRTGPTRTAGWPMSRVPVRPRPQPRPQPRPAPSPSPPPPGGGIASVEPQPRPASPAGGTLTRDESHSPPDSPPGSILARRRSESPLLPPRSAASASEDDGHASAADTTAEKIKRVTKKISKALLLKKKDGDGGK